MGRTRTFVGIPLPASVTDALVSACDSIRAADAGWRGEKWVPRQNMHVTLKFLGDIEDDSLAEVADAIEAAAAGHARFLLADPGIRAVPDPHRARMIWATFVDADGACASLAEELERTCLAFGIAPSERAYKPHATLVRARVSKRIRALALESARVELESAPDCVSVPSITLYSSRLTGRGPEYGVIRECRLGPA